MGEEKGVGGLGHHVLHYYGLLYWRDGEKKPPRHSSPLTRLRTSHRQGGQKMILKPGKSTNLHPSKKVKRLILNNKMQLFVRADAPSS